MGTKCSKSKKNEERESSGNIDTESKSENVRYSRKKQKDTEEELDLNILECEEGLKLNPLDPNLNLQMAYCLYLKGYYDTSLSYFQKAQNGDAKFELLHYCALACIYFQKQEFSNAQSLYKKALRMDSSCLEAHIKLGKIYLRQKDLKYALKHCEKAVKLNSSNSEARNNLGFCYLNLGRIHESVVHLEVAVALCPEFPKAHNNLGNAYRKLSNNSEAIHHYELAIHQTPKRNIYPGKFSVAHLNLGSTYFDIGDTAKAIRHFEEALNAGGSIHKLMVSKGYHLLFKHPKIKEGVESLLKHEYENASNLLSEVLSTDSDNPAVNYYKGYSLFKQGLLSKAQKYFEKTIESSNKPVHANKHFVKHFLQKAEKLLKKDTEEHPENYENSKDLRESCISLRGSAAFKVRAEILKLERLGGQGSPSPTDSKLDISDDISLPLMSEEGEDQLSDNFI